MMKHFYISASILSANLAYLGQEAKDVLEAGAARIHFDVMDNHYVPNLSFGPMLCRALRDFGINSPIDVHLMTMPVDSLIQSFAKAGAASICFHPEASLHVDRSLQLIRDEGCQAGLALNPCTSFSNLRYLADKIDWLLLMGVNPGFGGQSLIPSIWHKIDAIKQSWQNLGLKQHCRLEVDGGVNTENIGQFAQAGLHGVVSGSALFKQKPYPKTIKIMQKKIDKALNKK